MTRKKVAYNLYATLGRPTPDSDKDFVVAWERDESEPCERGTVGCCVDHTASRKKYPSETDCETW